MTLLNIIILIFALFAVSRAFLRYRSKDVTLDEFLFWTVIWGAIVAATFIPSLSSFVADLIGVGRGVDAGFTLGILLLFYLMFRIYVKVEYIDRDLTDLVKKLSAQSSSKHPHDAPPHHHS